MINGDSLKRKYANPTTWRKIFKLFLFLPFARWPGSLTLNLLGKKVNQRKADPKHAFPPKISWFNFDLLWKIGRRLICFLYALWNFLLCFIRRLSRYSVAKNFYSNFNKLLIFLEMSFWNFRCRVHCLSVDLLQNGASVPAWHHKSTNPKGSSLTFHSLPVIQSCEWGKRKGF